MHFNQNQTQSSVENFVTEISKFLWKYVSDYYPGPGRQSDFFHVKLHFTLVNEVVEMHSGSDVNKIVHKY